MPHSLPKPTADNLPPIHLLRSSAKQRPTTSLNPRMWGIILILTVFLSAVAFFRNLAQQAEQQAESGLVQQQHSPYVTIRLVKGFGSDESNRKPYALIGINYFNEATELDNAVIRLQNGEVWKAKDGHVRILWGNPYLVAKAQAPTLILFLILFTFGILMGSGVLSFTSSAAPTPRESRMIRLPIITCPKCGNKNEVALGQTACFNCGAELPEESPL